MKTFWQRAHEARRQARERREERAWEQAKLCFMLEDALAAAFPECGRTRVDYERQRFRIVEGPAQYVGRALTMLGLLNAVTTLECMAHARQTRR